jgi:cytochrome c-type protein NapC
VSDNSGKEKKEWYIDRLWRKPKGWWMIGVPVGGLLMFFAGIIFWGGFNWTLELTNTETFCISCHEMKDNPYMEYKDTIHYKNPAGVRASCPDCHVPHPWIYKIKRKIQASNELFHKLMGTIDTREKFLDHRAELAKHVQDSMRETDSRECRNCHQIDYMDLENQDKSARKKHAAVLSGELKKTCIDCHQGIAHHLPEEDEDEIAEIKAAKKTAQ